jgi:hypothetical protein
MCGVVCGVVRCVVLFGVWCVVCSARSQWLVVDASSRFMVQKEGAGAIGTHCVLSSLSESLRPLLSELCSSDFSSDSSSDSFAAFSAL